MNPPDSGGTLRCLLLRAGESFCAVPIERVRRVACGLQLHAVSGASPAFAGLVELGGEPLPVLDLARLVGATPGGRSGDPVIVVTWAGAAGAREAIGLLADAALRLVELPVPSGAPTGALVRGEVTWMELVVRVLDLELLGSPA